MHPKNDPVFIPVDVRLPRAFIEQAIDGELPPDVLKDFTVIVPILPSSKVGEKIEVYIDVKDVVLIYYPRFIDQQMLDSGKQIERLFWRGPQRVTEVSLRYQLTRLNGDQFDARRRVYGFIQP